MKTKLNYVFRISAQSCAKPGEWIERFTVKVANFDDPRQIAGDLAARHFQPTETGIKVQMLGLQKHTKIGEPEDPVTPMNNFTLTITRD